MTRNTFISPDAQDGQNEIKPDHTWVLFSLAEISEQLKNANLTHAASVIESSIQEIEYEVLTAPTKLTPLGGQSPSSYEGVDPSEQSNVYDFCTPQKSSE